MISDRSAPPARGRLIAVGIGIVAAFQTTAEAEDCIRCSDRLLYLTGSGPATAWLRRLNPQAESLQRFLDDSTPRSTAYERIADYIVACVRSGDAVCAAAYGHPGVLVTPLHLAIERAISAGFDARMLPGISADACLYADLGLDPGRYGAQNFDATDFLVYDRRFDATSLLVLWQIGVIGVAEQRRERDCWNRPALAVLAGVLAEHYGADHEVVLYQAAQFPFCRPRITRVCISDLARAPVTPVTTAVIPPLPQREPNRTVLARLQRR